MDTAGLMDGDERHYDPAFFALINLFDYILEVRKSAFLAYSKSRPFDWSGARLTLFKMSAAAKQKLKLIETKTSDFVLNLEEDTRVAIGLCTLIANRSPKKVIKVNKRSAKLKEAIAKIKCGLEQISTRDARDVRQALSRELSAVASDRNPDNRKIVTLSLSEAATRLGVHPRTITRRIAKGSLNAERINSKTYRFVENELNR